MLFGTDVETFDPVLSVVGLVSIPLLVAANGFFVAAEFALVAVRRTKIEHMVAQGVRGAAAVQSAIDHLDRSVAATQLGITLSSIGLGFIAERGLASTFQFLFAGLPAPFDALAKHSVAGFLALAIITFLHVVLGELFPKTVALQVPDRTALWIARPLEFFAMATRPLTIFMNATGEYLAKVLGFREMGGEHLVHSVEELALLIEDTEEAGILDPEQAELVQNVFLLSSKKVADCMVPREKMAALELQTPPDKVLEFVRSGAHTRLPVYQGELDQIVGIVNTKDLFYLFSLQGVVVLEDALYPALFLYPEEEIANALRLFRKAKRPMALVRDEAGKIHGLITLEDILEEIIGDIEDEHDQPKRRRLRKLRSRYAPRILPPSGVKPPEKGGKG